MADYISESWRRVLDLNDLNSFDALWRLQAEWFEPPNERRGGWSGVARYALPKTDGQARAIFLKRQENHKIFSWRHPIAGDPTFLREFHHIEHYRACGVPTLEPVYFAMRRTGGGHRAVLATAELSGYVSLEDCLRQWRDHGAPPLSVWRQLIARIADLARIMHAHRIQHNCFYPKHLFVRIGSDGSTDVRVIDLEKSRSRPLAIFCTLRDLDTLNRHARGPSRTDRLRFLMAYLEAGETTQSVRKLWRQLAARAAKKHRPTA